MRRLGLIALLVSLIAGGAFASHDWDGQVGYWSDANKWTNGLPDGGSSVRIRYDTAVCTLNTDESSWEASDKAMDVEDGAKLIIVAGGAVKPARVQIGTNDGPATLEQTGGLLSVYKDKLYVGRDDHSGNSTYTMSGGTLTASDLEGNDGYLYVGYDGTGKFTVVGIDPNIHMRKLYIGAHNDGSHPGDGTLEFKVGSSGVSRIKMEDNLYFDSAGADSNAFLVVTATAAPPEADIVLCEDMSGGSIGGTFDTVNGAAATEGASVVLSYGGTDYYYSLTYAYNATGDSNTNDVALVYVPEPVTLALLGFGGLLIRRRKK